MLPVFGCVKMKSNSDVFVDAILTTNKKEQGKKIKDKMRIKQEYDNKENDSRSLIFLKSTKNKIYRKTKQFKSYKITKSSIKNWV